MLTSWIGHSETRHGTIAGTPAAALDATLLMELLRRQMPQAGVATFRFKALRPTFDGHRFRVNGALGADRKTVKLWAQDHEGGLTMDAVATLRQDTRCKR